MKKMFMAAVLMMGTLLSACSGAEPSSGSGKLKVTTTIAQLEDTVRNVAGDKVEVNSLMGPGVDPHLYKASQGDIKKLSEADVILYNGLHLEGKMGEVFEKISKSKPVIPVAESVDEDRILTVEGNKNAHDPHVWFSIPNWIQVTDKVEEVLSKEMPEYKNEFKKNAEAYKAKLKEMDSYAREQIASIPEKSRVLVTAHDAFQYFGREYGMEVMGLQGLSTDSEYGLKDVQKLVGVLSDRNIKAVFVESSISQKSINAVVEGSKQKGHEVKIGGELYSDAMGKSGTEEGTYLGMFKHNVDMIVSSLK
ncbi:manganese transporter [Bacillus mangrovi]|uniref:Manganese transporter n=1 Tax=Metabacillus mangrovi TaxID=1491830 RepID=A0A7X2S7U3_9BACI|nr:zinc ABC transporter substrate-binding protein [Metabacillus mangrovi]MTH54411.1 manganese transporter [Metabacillus mangrovi]